MEIQENISLDIELLKRKMVSGIVTFTIRTFFIQVFTFISTFFLTIILAPEVFGVFFVVSAILNLFVYFSDIGLAAALIQKKDNLTKIDLSTTFFIQQTIVTVLIIIGLILSSRIGMFYGLNSEGIFLLRILIFSLLLSSLKTMPSIILERNLEFSKLVIPQIVETIVFYAVAILLALKGLKVDAFAWATLARGVTGLIVIYLIKPWFPTPHFGRESAKSLIRFGVPFQLNSVLALIKDDLITVFLGKMLTFTQVGYIGWAQKWSFVPLRFFLDSVNKVTFPAYSRLQDHKKDLANVIEKSIFLVTFFVYPGLFGIAALLPKIVLLIPNYNKWDMAVPLIYLFCLNAVFSAVSSTFTNVLFATGKPKIVLNFMIFWTALTWVLILPMIHRFSYLGVGFVSVIVASTSLGTIYFANREIKVKIGINVFGPLIISILMYIVIVLTIRVLTLSTTALVLSALVGTAFYFAISFIFFKNEIVKNLSFLVKSFTIR